VPPESIASRAAEAMHPASLQPSSQSADRKIGCHFLVWSAIPFLSTGLISPEMPENQGPPQRQK
jgi:hypothetical protein